MNGEKHKPTVRIARESDGLTFSLTPESREVYPNGSPRVFVGGPTNMDPGFYTPLRRKALVEVLTGGECSDATFEEPR